MRDGGGRKARAGGSGQKSGRRSPLANRFVQNFDGNGTWVGHRPILDHDIHRDFIANLGEDVNEIILDNRDIQDYLEGW
jgi:hypothetical protein